MTMATRSSAIAVLLAVALLTTCDAFGLVQQPRTRLSSAPSPIKTALSLSNDNQTEQERLKSLGYSDDEIKRSQKPTQIQPEKVRVDLIPNVDSVTLTAVGFGLIAFNFFVLANMGDGGLAGVIATIANASRN